MGTRVALGTGGGGGTRHPSLLGGIRGHWTSRGGGTGVRGHPQQMGDTWGHRAPTGVAPGDTHGRWVALGDTQATPP